MRGIRGTALGVAVAATIAGAGLALAPPSAGATSVTVQLVGGLASDNIEYIATIPIDSSAVSADIRTVDRQRRLFVSGVKGLTIYDISDPALPLPLGHLPLPHSQNEGVQVSQDGTRAIIAADGGAPAPNPVTEGLHIVDVSDPANPVWQAWLDSAGNGSNHTATCADAACEWIYGSSGRIYHAPADVASGADIEIHGRWWALDKRVKGSHALNRSVHRDPATGKLVQILISDSTPRLIIDVTRPGKPKLLATSDPTDHEDDGLLQHNNVRPNARQWKPMGTPQSKQDPFGGWLRPGELVIGNSESNLRAECGDSAGGLTTFSIRNFDRGRTMRKLHSFRPTNGNWADAGDPAFNALGCSGHWFDIRDGDDLIAASWYEHGVKVIEVMPDYSMRQVGFFQPFATEAGAAHWVDDGDEEYIFSIDYGRGIDILRFHRDAPAATPEQIAAAAAVASTQVGPVAAAERAYCRLAMQKAA